MRSEESFREDKIRLDNGDIALARGDLSGATQHYIRERDIHGLQMVAQKLYEQGKEEEAEKVYREMGKLSQGIDN